MRRLFGAIFASLEAARGRILPKKAELSELEHVLSLSMLVKIQALS